MIKSLFEQGSEAWFDARCGKITGTRFKTLMSAESTIGYKDLVTDLAGEILTGEIEQGYTNEDMQRGIDLEPEARKLYEYLFECEVEEVGFCEPDEDNVFHGLIGISPDGLLKDSGITEFKCPKRKTHLNYIEKNVMPNEYKWQIQGQLFVTGVKYCDFMSYHPKLKPFIIRVHPNAEMHESITEALKTINIAIKQKLDSYKLYDYQKEIVK